MRKSYVIDSGKFAVEFSRCCQEYNTLKIAVAWCGNPNQTLPYQFLENFNGNIKAIVGIAFNHTHPDAIEWFLRIGADIRIFKEDAELFHPKIYLFRDRKRYALFIGSSNLTYGGFYVNYEANCLIEGVGERKIPQDQDIALLEKTINKWHSQIFSFKPTKQWINGYRKRYAAANFKQRKQGIKTPPSSEEEIPTASWLQHADWNIYYRKVLVGLEQRERNSQGYHDVLDAAAKNLRIPWRIDYFEDIEKRRIMNGIKQYGWLGHVGASGRFRSLLANGTSRQKRRVVDGINAIVQLEPPIEWSQLKSHLDKLIALGPTMKVWSRLLCIVRPDLYCTVAANSVRKNLSKTLSVPKSRFDGSEGYIQLIKLIHSSPWFNSARPRNEDQANLWNRRAAFLDAIFY